MPRKLLFPEFFRSDRGVLVSLSFLVFLIHVIVNATTAYGYFRDEFYYIACSERLAFGYVDQPPLSILLLAATRFVLGDSLVALRLLPAVAAGIVVFLTGRVTGILGGGRYAQILAALCSLTAPQYLGMLNFFSMNAFDVLFWTIAIYLTLRIVKEDAPHLWIPFGIVAGLGSQNKVSILFLCFGIVGGLLLTSGRKHLWNRNFWIGGSAGLLIFLPHIIWQIVNDFPTAEFVKHATENKNIISSPLEFLVSQIMMMSPFTFPIWGTGLVYFFLVKDVKRFRFLGWTYVLIFVLFILQNGKPYYLSPMYPVLFAGGAVAISSFIGKSRRVWLRTGIVTVLLIGGIIAAPFALPVLPPEKFIAYSNALGIQPRPQERHEMGKLPQHYADMFGWKEKAEAVARAFHSLKPKEKQQCAIFTFNYGRAGAIDFFGKELGLPKAISNHNNYWLWGPKQYTGEIVIILAKDLGELRERFESVQLVETIPCDYCMPYEKDTQVFICRGLKQPIQELWESIKSFG
ncbi:MAG: glycosyltransferase family 39 protein [Bacteroidetes bacterium]|nr:glycosyltransferase family 39 protein [Bacteroidota bacterium]MCW5895947.1 glycosyltransferase family 39 protein [Bacteroidota bacterium]